MIKNLFISMLLLVVFIMIPLNVFADQIHKFVQYGDLKKVKLLLESDPNFVNLKNKREETPLHIAASGNNKEMVKLLIKFKPDLNALTLYGLTSLHLSAVFGRAKVAQELIQAGANLDIRSEDGGTPLHYATAGRYSKVIKMLESNGAEKKKRNFPILNGKYFGEEIPQKKPRRFAENILFNIAKFISPTFSSDGKEVYFSMSSYHFQNSKIWYMVQKNGRWQPPRRASFSGKYAEGSPVFSADGKKLFYYSNMPLNDKNAGKRGIDLYMVERQNNNNWSAPENLGPQVNSEFTDASPNIAKNLNLYFHRTERFNNQTRWFVYRANYINSQYCKPVRLPNSINDYNAAGPCIAADESFLIFHSDHSFNNSPGNHLFVSFKKANGNWTIARSLNDMVNKYISMSASLSPDGKCLFYYSKRGEEYLYYWINSKIINKSTGGEM